MKKEILSEKEERLKKLQDLKGYGFSPYPADSGRNITIKDLNEKFDVFEKSKKKNIIAGRIMSKRAHGNLIFLNIFDGTGNIQIAVSKNELNDKESFKIFNKQIDVSDFIEVSGECFVTHKGEKSVLAKDWKLLTKTLRPLPDKWHGLKDDEEILRKRYLDILLNDSVREMFQKRAIFWQSIREFLVKRNFLEVETPVLENTTGGADANPFVTHHKALDIDVYLRISMGELWQKRLMVAGYEKTFEIGRQFRNEGMSPEHLQDYTQMEFYWAYANYKDGMKLVEEMYKFVAKKTFGTLKFKIRGFDVDLGEKWKQYDYRDTVLKYTGVDILEADIEEMEDKLNELKIDYDKEGFNITRAIDNLWKYCRKRIGGPGFLVGVPVDVSPLAKRDDTNPKITQRFQPIIAGSELGNGYSELNDPIDQAERFSEQQKLRDSGDEEAQMYDHEFVEALEYGMPPTCGFGLSERVFSFLMDKPARVAQIFPLLRPKNNSNSKTSSVKLTVKNIGINYEEAVKLLDKYVKDSIIKLHMVETESIMRALAKHFGEDEEAWGIAGLLHDIDWEITKNDIKNHTVEAETILNREGGSQILIDAVLSHTYGSKDCGNNPNKSRSTRFEHSLAAAETVTGLVIANALMQPDKKLNSVKLSSLKKKFKQKAFAANCNREIIKEIEQTGLSLDKFFEISLAALQSISDKIGL